MTKTPIIASNSTEIVCGKCKSMCDFYWFQNDHVEISVDEYYDFVLFEKRN